MIRRTSTWILSLSLALAVIACGGKDEENSGSGGAAGLSQYGGKASPGAMYELAGAASVETTAPDDLSRLCPDGPAVFVRIRNLDALLSEADGIAATVGQPLPPVKEIVGRNLGIPGLKGVDTTRPIGVAVFVASAMQYSPILFLPLSSKSEFENALAQGAGGQLATTFLGDWVAIAQDPSLVEGLELRKEPAPIASRALMGDLAISVDLGSLYEKFGQQARGGLRGAASEMGEMPPGTSRSVSMATDIANTVLADSDYLTLAFGLNEGSLTLGLRYAAKPGTSTARFLASNDVAGTLLSRLGADGFMTSAANLNGELMWKLLGPALTDLEGMLPPDAMTAIRNMIPLLEGAAGSFGYQDGFTWTGIAGLTDGERFEASLQAAMPRLKAMLAQALEDAGAPPGALELNVDEGFEHEDVGVRGMSLTVNLPDDPQADEARKIMDFALGGPRLEVWYARVDDHFLVTLGAGAKQRMSDLVERLKAGGDGPAGSAFVRATAGFPARPTSLFFVDLGQIAKIVSKFPTEEMPPMLRRMLATPPENLWVASYYRLEDGKVDFGMRMSLKDLIEYGAPIVQGR